jgi:hypothetical protein
MAELRSEVAVEIEEYRGRMIYRSLRRHMEHAGTTMYEVRADEYFTDAFRPRIDTDFPGTPTHCVLTGETVAAVKDGVDKFAPPSTLGEESK